ncbi:copper chaperone PCu(A)C [Paracoccus laeviglucosivorans]|uniref:Copper(I)-binding protein n=1 Tax=Paracoccus laeviglucosivorans TaxID=1197861 RepID=A0A521BC66_9RHOB|nr:copper chaperone PCu(A)C [Paracoccus laeviglucosivorans]SMO44639.1 hypothetical protein SAMN06265221_102216 [Paracoccus laeviglucosivorans]
MQTHTISAILGALLLALPLGSQAQPVTQGDLTVSDGFMRAMPPNAPVAGGYLTITNNGTADDRLVSASSPEAGEVQVHEMTMNGDVMKMRELPDGLPIPAGQTVTLTPGGNHLMFLKVATPFTEGQTAHATLVFQNAGQLEVPLAVGPMNARKAGGRAPADPHAGH